jgi:hypothetical protein
VTAGSASRSVDELAPAGAEVVHDHDLDAEALSRSARLLPMKPAPPVMQARRIYRVKPAAVASRWNIWTVSSENCSRSLPSRVELLQQVVRHRDDVAAD